MIGVDLGIARLITLSNVIFVEPISSFKQHQDTRAKAMHALARKVKLSVNWRKQKACISRIRTRIASVRRDYLHKTSTTMSKNHAMIMIEDLKVGNMSRSAKGITEHSSAHVAAKSGLNWSILDQG
jgi:putative transposase